MKALIFDFETDGLLAGTLASMQHQPRATEFYGELIDTDTGEILDSLEFLCNPGRPLDDKIVKITGITDGMLRNEPEFKTFIPAIAKLLKKSDAVIAHNLYFDWSIANLEVKRANFKPLIWPKTKICTVCESEHYFGHRMKLVDLYNHLFDGGFKDAHRAKNDVTALSKCVIEMFNLGDL